MGVQNGYLDKVPFDRVKDFQNGLTEFLTTRKIELLTAIAREKTLTDALKADLRSAVDEFEDTRKGAAVR